jgi:hypothetical protein
VRSPRSVGRHRPDVEDRRPGVVGASNGGRRAPKSDAVDRKTPPFWLSLHCNRGVDGPWPEKSLSRGLGENYGQLRRDEIDGYLGNPGQVVPASLDSDDLLGDRKPHCSAKSCANKRCEVTTRFQPASAKITGFLLPVILAW